MAAKVNYSSCSLPRRQNRAFLLCCGRCHCRPFLSLAGISVCPFTLQHVSLVTRLSFLLTLSYSIQFDVFLLLPRSLSSPFYFRFRLLFNSVFLCWPYTHICLSLRVG